MVSEIWKETLGFRNEMARTPDIYLCIDGKVLDFSNSMGLEQLLMVMRSEFLDTEGTEEILLIGARTV